ncbi:Flp family type IVb pilin [Rugamonas aquatica]|nr:hypothetical protein [Rugamonas aquatica]
MYRPRQTPASFSHFLADASGATLLEYALLGSLASVVCIIALLAFFKS